MAASPDSSTEEPDLGATLNFMRQLWSVAHGLQSLSKHMTLRLGVTGPQRMVLRLLGQNSGSSAGELASLLKAHPSTLTGVFRRLEEHKLITRKTDKEDHRRSLFALTNKGRELSIQRRGTVEAAVRRALHRVSADELAATSKLLGIIADELEREVEATTSSEPKASKKR